MGSTGQGQVAKRWSPILPWCAPVLGLTGGTGLPQSGTWPACSGVQENTLTFPRVGIFEVGHSQAAAPHRCCSPALAVPGPHRKQGTNPWCHVGDKCL